MTDQPMRVLIVDDSNLVRTLLTDLLQKQPDMQVVGAASTGQEAVRRAGELQPDVILMDIHLPDIDGIQAAWLVANRAPHGAVIMVTSEERIDFLQKAMLAGAQGYVLKPFGNGEKLLLTMRDVHTRSLARRMHAPASVEGGAAADEEAPPPPRKQGQRIAVVGTKGGVGRTLVSVGLALDLRQLTQRSVLLFDADFLFGDVAVHLSLPVERTILDLTPHADALDSALLASVTQQHASGVEVLLPPPRPEQADALTADHVRAVLNAAALSYDYLVVDMAPSYDDRMLAILDAADVFVVVLTPHLGVLRNTHHFLEVARTLGYAQDRMCFVLNRANTRSGLTMEDVTSVLQTRAVLTLPSAGIDITQAINDGRPIELTDPRAPFSRAMLQVASAVRDLAARVSPAI